MDTSTHSPNHINMDSPFTELFSLLKRYENLSTTSLCFVYDSDELKVIHQLINNAVDVLLQGLQGIGQLIGITSLDKRIINALNHLGLFISAITNLAEALNDLRSDADYVLRQRGVTNY